MKLKNVFTTILILFALLFGANFATQAKNTITLELAIGGEDDAEEENGDSEKIENLQEEIEELEEKLEETQQKEQSLQRDIDSFNAQISLTKLKIEQSLVQIRKKEKEIVQLSQDIDDLSTRIEKLKDSIEYQTKVLGERMRARYKSRETSPVMVIFGSTTISTLIQKTEYLKVMENQDQKLINEMDKTQKAYALQKGLFEDKKEEEEILKQQLEQEKANLENYNAQLEQQKQEKKNLLEATQNDEQRYAELLADARRELQQIQGAANVVIREGNAVSVEEGEVIGTMGNSGNSTGPHLHFGVYKYSVEDFQNHDNWGWYYSNHIDPLDKLESKTVTWDTGCSYDPSGSKKSGDGDWEWPMSSVRITQNYGSNTCYNWMYSGNPHPALDIVGNGDISVRSVDDGEAYFCRNCLGDGGNGVFVFHDDDYMSVYWHLR